MIVDGQLVGGAAHGIGNSLYEWMGYDAGAQPLTTTFADYLLVTAPEVPKIEVHFLECPSPLNPLGVKGVGESGCVPARRRDRRCDRKCAGTVRRDDFGISGDAGAAVRIDRSRAR